MSVHSTSPSPLQVAANSPPDESNMPRGHCRYILLLPEIKGQRCACVGFSLNKGIPGATCDCGHLACFHNKDPEIPTDHKQKQELELLKRRLQHLEDQLSKGQEDVLDSVVTRVNEMEDHLEKSREEFGEQIKGAYRNVSMSWRSIEQGERRNQEQDNQLRQIYDKLRHHDEQLDRLHAGQLELRDADLSLEERIENLTETLEEEQELRITAALTAARPSRRQSTSDTSDPNVPLGPLGPGAAPSDTSPVPAREWMPLQAKLCDAETLLGLPMLRQLDEGRWRRHAPVFMEGLEDCWEYDALLDTDPFDGDMAVDDEDRPAAGDITTAVLPTAVATAGLKRPLAEMSRSNSFSSAGGNGPAAVAAATASAATDGDEARVKRSCPAPPQAAIVEIRRRDIKTA
ncbi:hypothetical protein N0V88_001116 [Collariella sp. IMI 366227]|nr:hypothetical protein N0V88_001116 [Collariella sp. IMI 366227]